MGHADGRRRVVGRPYGRRRATWGRSTVVDPWGKVIAALDHAQPGVLHARLDLDAVDRARRAIPSLTHDRPFRSASDA